jgi:hypothetical protein
MPHRVSEPEGQPANEDEAEDTADQRTPPERQLSVAPALMPGLLGFLAVRLFAVKISPHIPASPAFDRKKASSSQILVELVEIVRRTRLRKS